MATKAKKQTRLSTAAKNADNKKWYKEKAESIATQSINNWEKTLMNFNLFNNTVDLSYYDHVCQSAIEKGGKRRVMPAKLENKDIVSGKIKTLLGMEAKQPFKWKALASNSEASTRKEKKQFGGIKEFVINQIMAPIKMGIEQRAAQQSAGKELTPEQQQQMQSQIAEELKTKTPIEVLEYMQTEHQDPAEIMAHQILSYLIKDKKVEAKFNTGFKYANLSAREVYHIGIFNNEPELTVVNTRDFVHAITKDQELIEESEWAKCKYQWSSSEIIRKWGNQMTNKELDTIEAEASIMKSSHQEDMFDYSKEGSEESKEESYQGWDVIHTVWRSLRKIGFLTTAEGKTQIVSEDYKLNKELGDVDLEWEWLPEVYECWKVGDMYFDMQPVPGQFLDTDNPGNCPLPYYGAIYDNMNSVPTSTMDRLANYQHSYNITNYRVDLLMAQDKGKKLLIDVAAIPDDKNMKFEDWTYNFDSGPFAWMNLAAEGRSYADINTMSKVIDLSTAADVSKLREWAEYTKMQAGESIGITPAIEGQAGPDMSNGNNQQNLIQSSHVLFPLFTTHNDVKKSVLMGLLNTAKVAWRGSGKKKLTYILDDLTEMMLNIDMDMVEATNYNMFVENSSDADETKQRLMALADRALASDKVGLADVMTVMNQKGTAEAEASLRAAEQKKIEEVQAETRRTEEHQEKMQQMQTQENERAHEREKEIVILKEAEKRKTVVIQSSLVAASFNADQDADGDGVNDFVEIARDGLDADIRAKEHNLERDKFEHSKVVDKEKLKIDKAKTKK